MRGETSQEKEGVYKGKSKRGEEKGRGESKERGR